MQRKIIVTKEGGHSHCCGAHQSSQRKGNQQEMISLPSAVNVNGEKMKSKFRVSTKNAADQFYWNEREDRFLGNGRGSIRDRGRGSKA